MARNKKWTVSFASQNGTTCRVDIYKQGYSGSTVDTLTAADDPFYYEETDSNDLLSDVVRYKTGYLRLMELTAGGLDALRPSNNSEHYIEFYYGSVLAFTGYMQAQDFSQNWEACPRVIEFPIVSPLGLLKDKTFDIPLTPSMVTLGSLVDQVITKLNAAYTRVYFPWLTSDPIQLNETIHSLVMVPWNDDFEHADMQGGINGDGLFDPQTLDVFIDALCKAFGWICHETPTAIIFSMFDHTSYYRYYPVGNVGNTSQQSGNVTVGALNIDTYLTYADDDAKQTQLLPYRSIKMEYDGELNNDIPFAFDRAIYYGGNGVQNYNDLIFACSFVSNLNIDEFHSSVGGGLLQFSTDGTIASHGVYLIAYNTIDDINVKEGIAICINTTNIPDIDPGTTQEYEVFRMRIYTNLTSLDWRMEYDYVCGETLRSMSNNDPDHTVNIVAQRRATGDGYVEFKFLVRFVYKSDWPYMRAISDKNVAFISNIHFTLANEEVFEPYTKLNRGYDKIKNNIYSPLDESITLPISMYRTNDHMIGSTVRTTKVTTYPYLLQPRTELQAKFRYKAAMPDLPYCNLWNFDSKKWRIIAMSFHPWDDEYELIIQHSTIFNG